MSIYLKKIIKIFVAALFIVFTFSLLPLFINPVQADSSMPKLQIPDLNINFSPKACATDNSGKTVCYIGWIGEYVAGVYKYAIGIVGILAAVVLMIGGVIWIMAGGSATAIGEAKAWIGAALTGLIIALTSYLILYQINPDLTVFKPLRVASPGKAPEIKLSTLNCKWEDGSNICPGGKQIMPGQCGKPLDNLILKPQTCCCATSQASIISSDRSDACEFYNNDNVIDYSEVAQSSPLPNQCNNYNFGTNRYWGNILKSIAAAESSCNPNAQATTDSGLISCGLMQIQPATAQDIVNRYGLFNKPSIDCDWLKKHPDESIEIAKNFIQSKASHRGLPVNIFAGYNSGYSTANNNNKKAALAPSDDCSGKLAYECCIKPGGLVETQNYVVQAKKYFNGLK